MDRAKLDYKNLHVNLSTLTRTLELNWKSDQHDSLKAQRLCTSMTANMDPDKQQWKEKSTLCPEFRDQGKSHSELPTSSYPTSYTNNIKMNSKRNLMCISEK